VIAKIIPLGWDWTQSLVRSRAKHHLNIFGAFLLHESWEHFVAIPSHPIYVTFCSGECVHSSSLLRSNHEEQLQMVVTGRPGRTLNGFSSVPGERALSSPLNSVLREQGGLQPELAVLCLAVSPVPPYCWLSLAWPPAFPPTAVCMPYASCFPFSSSGSRQIGQLSQKGRPWMGGGPTSKEARRAYLKMSQVSFSF